MNEQAQLRAAISKAFEGVKLGSGMTLRQAQATDRYLEEPLSPAQYAALRRGDVTENWAYVPRSELDRDCVAHLDAEGLRYYLPALMLSVLDAYEPSEMRVIGTLMALCPDKKGWPYHMERYKLLNAAQKAAIALFLQTLPRSVPMDREDSLSIERALRNYWHEFLAHG